MGLDSQRYSVLNLPSASDLGTAVNALHRLDLSLGGETLPFVLGGGHPARGRWCDSGRHFPDGDHGFTRLVWLTEICDGSV